MQQAFHVFGYLIKHARSRMVFEKMVLEIDQSHSRKVDWTEIYPEAKEAIPQDAPELRGVLVVMSCFVDSDHAACRLTRWSHTCVLTLSQCIQYPVPVLHSRLYYSLTIRNAQDQSCSNQEQ
jgi:hypothetical protein